MKYKGYEAVVAFDTDDRILHGRLLCTQDVVSFGADNVNELEQAFRAAVDDYMAQCPSGGCQGRNQLESMDHGVARG